MTGNAAMTKLFDPRELFRWEEFLTPRMIPTFYALGAAWVAALGLGGLALCVVLTNTHPIWAPRSRVLPRHFSIADAAAPRFHQSDPRKTGLTGLTALTAAH
jgi:hypothetical protein